MSMSGSMRQMRENFEAQFEVEHDRYVYRRNQKGEPIPVTAEERARFIRQYVRRIRFTIAGMMVALLAFVGLVIWRTATTGELSEALFYVGLAVIPLIAVGLMYWLNGAPARELQGRTPVGRERSRDEMRAIFFKKIGYGQLAGVAVVGALFPFTLKSQQDVFHGWGRLWIIFGAAIVMLAAIQAFRKWRFERGHPDDTY